MIDCVTLWIGDELGPVERACLRSMVRHCRTVTLYCYREPSGVPAGVSLGNADAIISLPSLEARCGTRSDLYSDYFRYLLLERGLGTWLDMDVYVVSEIDGQQPYLFGALEPGALNGAVLRLPAASEMLASLIDQFRRNISPNWLPWRYYVPIALRRLIRGEVDLQRTPWGTTGPHAITAFVRAYGLERYVQPQARFYPMPWQRSAWILDPEFRLEDVITSETSAIHLWNECIRGFKNDRPPKGSFLERLHVEGRE